MNEFDVIVIGGGPAGCYAALTAATKGLKTALFEEHHAIGWPRHDPGWLMECDFSKSLIKAIGNRVAWSKVKEYRICNPDTGEVTESSPHGGFIMRRDILEKEVAARAARAGAKLFLKTRVEKLVTKQGKVTGVETNSATMPTASAQIFICADGIRSSDKGLALAEGLCEKGEVRPGMSYQLANADVTAGVIEHFVSAKDALLNYRVFFTQGDGTTFLSIPSDEGFDELKRRDDNFVSRKIKNAYPLEVNGFARAQATKYGQYFKKMVKGNVMFIGDASGGAGNIHGMIQGQLAADVAVAAIKEKDITEKRLAEYQHKVESTLVKAPFCWYSAREDFGSFDNWFRAFDRETKGIEAEGVG